jgi:pectin methylesterase-like acyl-CoA thioesterase
MSSQLSGFSAEKILQQVDARAKEFAKQQMSLDFGSSYDTSAPTAPTFPKHNFSVALKKNADGEVFLHMKIAIAKDDSEEDKALAKNYLTYLNDNYDTIIEAFREELQSSVAGAEESEALAQSRVQSGEFIKTTAR